MKFERVELRHITLEMVHPFVTSFGRWTERHLVILKAFSDVGICYAEAPSLIGPFYTYETTQTTLHILKDFILPALLGQEINSGEELHQFLEFIRGHNIAKSSMDTAFYHLMSALKNKSLSHYLGGTQKAVEVGISIGIQENLEALLDRVDWALQSGYNRIKFKIKPGWDIEPTRLIRERFGDIMLMVDANAAYTLRDIEIFKELDRYNLLMIEQPLSFEDIYAHSLLQKEIVTPICLDESIETLSDAKMAAEIGACKIINIKLSRVGGLYPAVQIHDLCQRHDIPVWCGGMLESAIGRADAIALASLPNFTLPADITPSSRYFIRDVVDSNLEINQGYIEVPSGFGSGLEVDEDFLEQATVEEPLVIEAV